LAYALFGDIQALYILCNDYAIAGTTSLSNDHFPNMAIGLGTKFAFSMPIHHTLISSQAANIRYETRNYIYYCRYKTVNRQRIMADLNSKVKEMQAYRKVLRVAYNYDSLAILNPGASSRSDPRRTCKESKIVQNGYSMKILEEDIYHTIQSDFEPHGWKEKKLNVLLEQSKTERTSALGKILTTRLFYNSPQPETADEIQCEKAAVCTVPEELHKM